MKEHLMGKNVAEEIARSLMASLRNSLIDTKTKAFTSVHTTGN